MEQLKDYSLIIREQLANIASPVNTNQYNTECLRYREHGTSVGAYYIPSHDYLAFYDIFTSVGFLPSTIVDIEVEQHSYGDRKGVRVKVTCQHTLKYTTSDFMLWY